MSSLTCRLTWFIASSVLLVLAGCGGRGDVSHVLTHTFNCLI